MVIKTGFLRPSHICKYISVIYVLLVMQAPVHCDTPSVLYTLEFCICISTNTYIPTCIYNQYALNISICTYVCTYTYMYLCAYITCVHTYMHAYICTCICNIRTFMLTNIHTFVCVYIYVYILIYVAYKINRTFCTYVCGLVTFLQCNF